MRPLLAVEFHTKDGDVEFDEESVRLHSPEALFAFVAPGGGCNSADTNEDKERLLFQEVWLPLADLYKNKIIPSGTGSND